jgi:hypothetical protein
MVEFTGAKISGGEMDFGKKSISNGGGFRGNGP